MCLYDDIIDFITNLGAWAQVYKKYTPWHAYTNQDPTSSA